MHELKVIVQIMDGIELRPKDFIGLLEVMQICTGKVFTGVALATHIYGSVVIPIASFAEF